VVLLGFAARQDYREYMAQDSEVFPVKLLLPNNNEEHSIQVGREEHIWDAAFAAGIVLPALCHQGYCLTCAARLEGGGDVDQSDSLVYFPEDREAGFILPCTGKPRSALKIRTHQQKQMRQFRKQKRLLAPYSWREE
jgi:ferredoxin